MYDEEGAVLASSSLESWSRFVSIYTPAIYAFLQQQGLQEADAADLSQDVMTSVARAIKSFEYQPGRGRFRGWLFTLVQNRLRNFRRAAARHPVASRDSRSAPIVQQAGDEQQQAWDREYERQLFAAAAARVQPAVSNSTWQAFRGTLVEGRPAPEVAADLAMSAAAVRLAKARVLARIKSEIKDLEGETT